MLCASSCSARYHHQPPPPEHTNHVLQCFHPIGIVFHDLAG
jgi:hypothetical protein